MMFGDSTDPAEADRIVGSAREAGINFIDTADVYAGGESERIVGRAIRPDRDRWVLATKVGNAMAPMAIDPNRRGLGRKWVMRAIDDSLRRLGTDYVDLYYLHVDDENTPLEETVTALDSVISAGKVRYWAVSNYRGWRISEIANVAANLGAPPPVACQPYYNAMNRMPEVEVLPACAYHRMGVVPYSPIARGVLTGKYRPGGAPDPGTRAGRRDTRIMETEFREESLVMAQTIKAHAETRGLSAVQFAVRWVLANRLITSVIAGPRTLAQWIEYLGASEYEWTAEDEALIDSLVPVGHPSTPGYSDPRYPIRGRVTDVAS